MGVFFSSYHGKIGSGDSPLLIVADDAVDLRVHRSQHAS